MDFKTELEKILVDFICKEFKEQVHRDFYLFVVDDIYEEIKIIDPEYVELMNKNTCYYGLFYVTRDNSMRLYVERCTIFGGSFKTHTNLQLSKHFCYLIPSIGISK